MHNFNSQNAHPSPRRCEICEDGNAVGHIESQPFQYGEGEDAVTLSANVMVWSCNDCGEQYTEGDAEESRHEAICTHLGRLSPKELRQMRDYYGHTQESWAALTRIGVASIKRWENGNQIQNASADQYLRLLANQRVYGLLVRTRYGSGPAIEPCFRTELSEVTRKKAAKFELRLELEPNE